MKLGELRKSFDANEGQKAWERVSELSPRGGLLLTVQQDYGLGGRRAWSEAGPIPICLKATW